MRLRKVKGFICPRTHSSKQQGRVWTQVLLHQRSCIFHSTRLGVKITASSDLSAHWSFWWGNFSPTFELLTYEYALMQWWPQCSSLWWYTAHPFSPTEEVQAPTKVPFTMLHAHCWETAKTGPAGCQQKQKVSWQMRVWKLGGPVTKPGFLSYRCCDHSQTLHP